MIVGLLKEIMDLKRCLPTMRKFTKYPQGYVQADSNIKDSYTEYAVEVYSTKAGPHSVRDDRFLYQLDVYATPEDAYTYCESNPLSEPDEFYVIRYISYEDGEEVETGRYDELR